MLMSRVEDPQSIISLFISQRGDKTKQLKHISKLPLLTVSVLATFSLFILLQLLFAWKQQSENTKTESHGHS